MSGEIADKAPVSQESVVAGPATPDWWKNVIPRLAAHNRCRPGLLVGTQGIERWTSPV